MTVLMQPPSESKITSEKHCPFKENFMNLSQQFMTESNSGAIVGIGSY